MADGPLGLEPVDPHGPPPIAPDVWRDAYAMLRGAVYDDNEGMAAILASADLPELARALALITNGFLIFAAQSAGATTPAEAHRSAMALLESAMRTAGVWYGD